MSDLVPGEPGAGGYRAAWHSGSDSAAVAEHVGFQYAGIGHQTGTAQAGLWLFLATELLFFGGLFLLYAVDFARHPGGTLAASRETTLWIGALNSVILLCSSGAYTYGLGLARRGDNRGLFRMVLLTAALGTVFLLLKGYEWYDDIARHLFPGPTFALPAADGGALFWCFYFVATGLHGVHMIIGLVLLAWIGTGARKRRYSSAYYTPVEGVGLYWSFVDMVWITLFPCLYLVGR